MGDERHLSPERLQSTRDTHHRMEIAGAPDRHQDIVWGGFWHGEWLSNGLDEKGFGPDDKPERGSKRNLAVGEPRLPGKRSAIFIVLRRNWHVGPKCEVALRGGPEINECLPNMWR